MLLATAAPAGATSTPAQIAASTTSGVAYLKTLQAADGSYAGSGLSNEWAFSAFAAAGTAAADVHPGTDASKNARAVYRNLLATATWPSASPVVTDYEHGALNAYAAGIDPERVGTGRNLVADIASYLKVCSVAVTATGTTTTLGAVLNAAATSAFPAGCVTSLTPSSGSGSVTALNGAANSGASTWKSSIDGGTPAATPRGTTSTSATPSTCATAADPPEGAGPAGTAPCARHPSASAPAGGRW